jgi:uncharacterized protein (DUF2141 family)
MRVRPVVLPLLLAAAAPALSAPSEGEPGYIRSTPDLGKAEGRCRPDERGPAVVVTLVGLKDRAGTMKAEVYPPGDKEFLEDDNILVMDGKTFRRAEINMPESGPVQVCVRLPGPGVYTLTVLHDRDRNRKFGISSDGIGFPNNPKLGLSKPKASAVRFTAGPGVTDITIRMNYRRGMFSFGPLKQAS